MDLTLQSAFSTGGLVGHLSYLLLVVSMLMNRMSLLRLFVILSSLVSIAFDIFWLRNPIGVFWEGLLVAVNIVQLALLHWRNLTSVFDPREQKFVDRKFPGLSRAHCRKLLNTGKWTETPAGTVLTHEGLPADELVYIASGTVDIEVKGVRVSQCGAGDFIGEITVLTRSPATARTITTAPAMLWRVGEKELAKLVRRHPDIGRELDASFARNYRDKIIQSNRLLSEGIVP
jgi:hypothetical protein